MGERRTFVYRSFFHFVEKENTRNTPDQNEAPLISITEATNSFVQGNDEHGLELLERGVENEEPSAGSHTHPDQTVIHPWNGVDRNAIVEAR